jgi:hypothetical protein
MPRAPFADPSTQPETLMNASKVLRRCLTAVLLALTLAAPRLAAPVAAQGVAQFDIARQAILQLPPGATARNMAIYGVTLGMSWGDARNVLDRANVPYLFQKGTSPIVYVPPQNSAFYYVLNPSSYEVIEMGIVGTSTLPLDNQYLFDAQRWRLTTARTQFFGNEGEFIVNEEGEAYNFPFQGFVLKYLLPEGFRFVMVDPTNKPLTTGYGGQRATAPAAAPPPGNPLEKWLQKFQAARSDFEARRYATALAAFKEISEGAPDALLKVRAVYWMGESHFGLAQYRDATREFERVLKMTDIESLRSPAQRMIDRCKTRK